MKNIINKKTIDKLTNAANEAPRFKKTTRRGKYSQVADSIKILRKKGYSWAATANFLTENGVKASVPALINWNKNNNRA